MREALASGVQLFNQGQFWDAHEAWEEAWLEEEGEAKLFLQGLIQVAAGFHKATVQDQPRGCVKLLTAGLEKLLPLPDAYQGLELARFRSAIEGALEHAKSWLAGEASRFDRAQIPQLQLE